MEVEKEVKIKRLESKEWQCHLLDGRYQISQGDYLGRGAYGAVYRAKNLNDGFYYALKKMEYIDDKCQIGFPITTIRQIMILQLLKHPQILNINEVVYEKSRKDKPPIIYICLDLMQCDLDKIIYNNNRFRLQIYHIQELLRSLLQGVAYLHSQNICHRDIKPSNLLINEEGELKVADFGLAKKLAQLSTTRVVTLLYRAPELLLGMKNYTTKIDIWSVGCVGAELVMKKPLFHGIKNETQIMKLIFERMGTPDHCNWTQDCQTHGRYYKDFKPETSQESTIVDYLKNNSKTYQAEFELFDLLSNMLRLNPSARYSAQECLEHNFFKMKYEQLEPHIKFGDFLKMQKQKLGQDILRKKLKST